MCQFYSRFNSLAIKRACVGTGRRDAAARLRDAASLYAADAQSQTAILHASPGAGFDAIASPRPAAVLRHGQGPGPVLETTRPKPLDLTPVDVVDQPPSRRIPFLRIPGTSDLEALDPCRPEPAQCRHARSCHCRLLAWVMPVPAVASQQPALACPGAVQLSNRLATASRGERPFGSLWPSAGREMCLAVTGRPLCYAAADRRPKALSHLGNAMLEHLNNP